MNTMNLNGSFHKSGINHTFAFGKNTSLVGTLCAYEYISIYEVIFMAKGFEKQGNDIERVENDITLLKNIIKDIEPVKDIEHTKDIEHSKDVKLTKCECQYHHHDIKRIISLATQYGTDAGYFLEKKDTFTAFGAINYAHGLIDALRILKGKL